MLAIAALLPICALAQNEDDTVDYAAEGINDWANNGTREACIALAVNVLPVKDEALRTLTIYAHTARVGALNCIFGIGSDLYHVFSGPDGDGMVFRYDLISAEEFSLAALSPTEGL